MKKYKKQKNNQFPPEALESVYTLRRRLYSNLYQDELKFALGAFVLWIDPVVGVISGSLLIGVL